MEQLLPQLTSAMIVQLAILLPRLLLAIVVLAIGWLAAAICRRTAQKIAERFHVDGLIEGSDLAGLLKRAGVQRTLSQWIATLVFWAVLTLALVAACDTLQLPALNAALAMAFRFLPRLAVSLLLLAVGFAVATAARRWVTDLASQGGIEPPAGVGWCAYGLIVLVGFLAAFRVLDIRLPLLGEAVLILLGGASLAFGLSVGLGARDVAGGIVAGWYVRRLIQPGDRIQVAGIVGRVREVGAVATVVETEDAQGMMERRSVPNTVVLRQAIR